MNTLNYKNKITFIAGSMGSGGAERVISILANSYANDGWKVDIVMLLDDTCYYELHENIRLIPMCNNNTPRIFYLPKWIMKLRKYLRDNNSDVIVSFIASINIITILSSFGLKGKVIISERSNPKRDGRSILKKIATMLLYPKATRVIFQTKAAQSCFIETIINKSLIIPNPVNTSAKAKKERKEIIVSIGRLRPEKNHQMLINAFQKIKEEFPNYKLHIYGEGPLREDLMMQINELKLTDSVFLLGNINNIHEEIADSEIFVLPSKHEGLSNALIEAMMMGLPCISTNYEGASEIIKNGENGILTPVNDAEMLYKEICSLINDKKKAITIGIKGQESVQKMRVENILPIWKSVIDVDD